MAAKHGMSSADAAWLRMDSPTNLMIVNSVLWFEEPVDWKRLRKVFQERIVDVFPRFRQIAVEPLPPRRPFWQDCEDFELGVHLHHVRLPAPGDDRVLREFTSDVMSRPLDRTKPLWEMYLVDDYRGGSAVITRIHHAVADGIALARLMMLLTDPSPRGRHNGTHFAAREHSRLDALLSLPGQVVHEVTHALPADVRALAKTLLALPDASTRLRGPLVAQNRVAWSRELSLARIKRIGKRYDATVNDVLVAAVAGAIARYLKDNGDELKRIHAMVPFNLRPLDEPVDPKLGNEFALVRLTLPIDERTPRKRLLATKHEMDAIKESREPAIAFAILSLIGLAPPRLEAGAVKLFSSETSLVLTNVPGPREPVYLAGTKVAGVLPWAPCAGSIGMTVTIFSYAGGVRVGFMTDEHRVPDPETLARNFAGEISALAKTTPRKSPAPV